MGKKFDAIYEAVVSRSEIGGVLVGDYVNFRPNYKSTETYKYMPTPLQKEVDELATCGLNIKVCQVGDKVGGYSLSNQHKTSNMVILTIAADHGGGRTYGRVAVTLDMVDLVDVGAGVPVPDQFKRKDTVIIKPKQLKIDPKLITNVTDKGNGKNTPTDLKLAGESKAWESTKELGMIYESMVGMNNNFQKAVQNFQKGSGQELDIQGELVPTMYDAVKQGMDFGGWVKYVSDNFDIRIQNMDFDIIDLLQKEYARIQQ